MKNVAFVVFFILTITNVNAQSLIETLDYINARISKTTDYVNKIYVTNEGFIEGEGIFWSDIKKIEYKIIYKAIPSKVDFQKNEESDYRLVCNDNHDCFITVSIPKKANPKLVDNKASFFRFTVELLTPDETKAFENALNILLKFAVGKNRIYVDTKTKNDPFMIKVKNNDKE